MALLELLIEPFVAVKAPVLLAFLYKLVPILRQHLAPLGYNTYLRPFSLPTDDDP